MIRISALMIKSQKLGLALIRVLIQKNNPVDPGLAEISGLQVYFPLATF